METCSLSTKTDIDSETSQKEMKSILKKIPLDLITFEDIINEQIKLMQNSAEEYDKFLKLLDDLITRIDLESWLALLLTIYWPLLTGHCAQYR